PLPEDLYRYNSNGVRNWTTAGDNAFFSIDGTNRLVQFNQDSGGDYGDWWSNNGGGNPGPNPPPRVQDAFGFPGTSPTLATDAGLVELRALNVIGYTFQATHFSVTAPAVASPGTAFNFTVTALDPMNNTVPGYTGTVHFTSTDGAAALPANTTLTNG